MVGLLSSRTTFACALAAILSASGLSSAAGPELTPVLQGEGLVRVHDDGDFGRAADGTKITQGNALRSGPANVVIVKVAPGVTVRLTPDTSIAVHTAAWLPPEHPGAHSVRAFQFALNSGEIDIDAHDPGGAVGALLNLPGGDTFGLWRGAANVSIRDGNVSVALYDGMATVGSASRWKSLNGETGATLSKKGDVATHPIPSVPTWNETAPEVVTFAMVRGDDHAPLGIAWNAAPGAATYRIEIARDPAMKGPIAVTETGYTLLKTEPLAPGAYFARVRAISSDGIAGPPSPTKALRVAHITVPSNAYAARDGVVVLPPSAAITLDDPRDLEFATAVDGAKSADLRWAPAPEKLTLAGAPRRELRIRHASTTPVDADHPAPSDAALILIRRELHARVTLGPRPARWPQNPIDISVKLEDKSGYLDPAREPVTVDVAIGIEHVDVPWAHAGDTWTARLPPHMTGPGPWVVRVYVHDRAGVDIGGGLLDVDGPSHPTTAQPDPGNGLRQVTYTE